MCSEVGSGTAPPFDSAPQALNMKAAQQCRAVNQPLSGVRSLDHTAAATAPASEVRPWGCSVTPQSCVHVSCASLLDWVWLAGVGGRSARSLGLWPGGKGDQGVLSADRRRS